MQDRRKPNRELLCIECENPACTAVSCKTCSKCRSSECDAILCEKSLKLCITDNGQEYGKTKQRGFAIDVKEHL